MKELKILQPIRLFSGIILATALGTALVKAQDSRDGANNEGTRRAESTHGNEADRELAKLVHKRLASDRWVPAFRITTAAEEGKVTLSGTVPNLLAKQRAQQLARAVAGVRELNNEIQVVFPAREDWRINADVSGVLRSDKLLQDADISTQVRQAVVVLTGMVDSGHKKQLAEALAMGVESVRGVENQLKVVYATERPDNTIEAEIANRVEWNPWMANPQVAVLVKEGRVRMTGVVESAQGLDTLRRDAWVPGVSAVDVSGIKVVPNVQSAFLPPRAPDQAGPDGERSSEGPLGDADIERNIVMQLESNARLRGQHVRVRVQNGEATLDGTVSSDELVQAAIRDAYDGGASKVHSILETGESSQGGSGEAIEK